MAIESQQGPHIRQLDLWPKESGENLQPHQLNGQDQLAERPFTPRKITSDDVTRFYQVRTALWTAKTFDDIQTVARQYEIPLDGIDPTTPVGKTVQKQLFTRYAHEYFPHSDSIESHWGRLNSALVSMVHHLTVEQSNATVWVFGSFAKGKINGTQSDLDYLVVLPKCETEEDIEREIGAIKGLQNSDAAGYVFSEELGPFDDLKPILREGQGLTRLYAMTEDGIEVEFHVIGIDDAMRMHKTDPGYIQRIKPVVPKDELRVSMTGVRRSLPKADDRVHNFIMDDGEMFVGFFPDAIIRGHQMYDPLGVAHKVSEQMWKAYVSTFLYRNNAFKSSGDEFSIDLEEAPFSKFLGTLYYGDPTDYHERNLSALERRYYNTVAKIAQVRNRTIRDRRTEASA
ncbi:MAG TPA: nucleotidyltransferase domain-containing protein [Patescibacteria group bacterium]|nr:nucleotidyltransferase domain-containing protein [Patescibacteria group bacterium]